MEETKKFNQTIRGWSRETVDKLRSAFDKLNIKHLSRSPSPRSSRDVLTSRVGTRQGLASRVGFRFPRHMVFVHKGVGKGVPASLAGSSVTTRKAKEWFNPVIDKNISDLADIAADGMADITVGNIHIH